MAKDLDKDFDAEIDLSAEFDSEEDLSAAFDAEGSDSAEALEAPGLLESGARGAAQGISLGFSDEITGALESSAGSLGLVEDKTYEQARDEARAANIAAQKANPLSYGGGEIAGGIGSMLIPGLGAAKVAKGASALSKLGSAAKTGAKLGGLYGAGSSEGQTAVDVAKDTAAGAGSGALLSAALPGLFSKGALGKGANMTDALKKTAMASGAGAALGVGADLAAGGETDILGSAAQGALGGAAVRGITRAGAKLYDMSGIASKADNIRAHNMGTRGEKLVDQQTFNQKSEAFSKEVSNISDDIAVANKNLTDTLNRNKDILLDERALASQQGQDKLKILVSEVDDVVSTVKDDIGRTYDLVEREAADVVFSPAKKLEDFIQTLDSDVAFTRLDDTTKAKIIDNLRNNAYTGKSSLKEVNELRKLISGYSNVFKSEPVMAAKFNRLYADINDDVVITLQKAGKEEVAGLLQDSNKKWSSMLQLQKNLSNKSPEARAAMLKKTAETLDAGKRATSDNLRGLAQEADSPMKRLTSYLDEAESASKQIADNSGRVPEAQLRQQAASGLDDGQRVIAEGLQEIEQFGSINAKDKLTGELLPEGVRNFKNKVSKLLVEGANDFAAPERAEDLNRLRKASVKVLGPEKTEELFARAMDQGQDLALMGKVSKSNSFESSPLSKAGIAKDVIGTLSKIEARVANYLGRLKAGKTGEFSKALTKDEGMMGHLADKAKDKGYDRLSNVLNKLPMKDMVGRNALMFTLLQDPSSRQQLLDLQEEE